MKTKEQILEGHVILNEYGHMVPISNAKFVMDEYAEEYAKAVLKFISRPKYLGGVTINPEEMIKVFKESLKR